MPLNTVVQRLIRRRDRKRRKEKVFRRLLSSYEINRHDFFLRFRFLPEMVLFIVNLPTLYVQHLSRKFMALTTFQQIIIALRFYSTGLYYRLVGDSFVISVVSVARFVDRVSLALCYITRQFITFPVGRECSEIKRCFYDIAGFPNVLGAEDGKLIRNPTQDDYF
ncbi:hypothetical protein KUTeg_018864 [Tegillarca granosa]|uniref:Uncharacterized protein n=1 Tax=Tegillarca granosa TaxID=220873 RepID=A0ABQ9EAV9_TEGGR|nr:hypothetical protein KUTeg_018864 [Tegillarca granosa]